MKTITKMMAILLMALLLPDVVMAQGDGSGKKPNLPTPVDPTPGKKQNKTKISDANGFINGHGYVDLGLPSGTKWATCNVGASSPEEYGSYFAWGEPDPKPDYRGSTSKTYGKSIGDISGNPDYDAARANWGGSWRLPNEAECEELVNECKWTWTSFGRNKGYKVVGPNGNSIFLPAAGFRYGTTLYTEGSHGDYWSGTPYEGFANYAYYMWFIDSDYFVDQSFRYAGQSVRPVSE